MRQGSNDGLQSSFPLSLSSILDSVWAMGIFLQEPQTSPGSHIPLTSQPVKVSQNSQRKSRLISLALLESHALLSTYQSGHGKYNVLMGLNLDHSIS